MMLSMVDKKILFKDTRPVTNRRTTIYAFHGISHRGELKQRRDDTDFPRGAAAVAPRRLVSPLCGPFPLYAKIVRDRNKFLSN